MLVRSLRLLRKGDKLSAEVYSRAGLILELFPSITQVKIVVRRRSARASTMANNIATLFPTVTITLESSEEEAVAKAVETADIICTYVSLSAFFAQHSRRQFLTSVAFQLRAFDDTAL